MLLCGEHVCVCIGLLPPALCCIDWSSGDCHCYVALLTQILSVLLNYKVSVCCFLNQRVIPVCHWNCQFCLTYFSYKTLCRCCDKHWYLT